MLLVLINDLTARVHNMNNNRRKRINAILAQLAACREELTGIHAEECEAYEAMPQSIREGERGEASEADIGSLDEAISSLEEIYGCHQQNTAPMLESFTSTAADSTKHGYH